VEDCDLESCKLTGSSGPRSTIQFPVQFEESGSGLSLVSAFEPKPPQSGDPAVLAPTHPLLPTPGPPDLGAWSPAPSDPPTSEPATNDAGTEKAKEQKVPEAEWRVSVELRLKCRKQFMDLQPTHGRLQGDQARSFFIQSRLPNSDLSAIWRLADMDRDNALSEEEFCIAMKLVLLRRKGYSLPTTVPLSLRDRAASGEGVVFCRHPLSPVTCRASQEVRFSAGQPHSWGAAFPQPLTARGPFGG
jgi:hypothetical protein